MYKRQQYGLVEKTKEYNLENAAKGYLPQLALSAKASYQSEVTEIPVKLPGVDLKGLPKDQYQVIDVYKRQTQYLANPEKNLMDLVQLSDVSKNLYILPLSLIHI